jgi:hypothetical protein
MVREIQELLQEKMLLEREVQEQEYNIQARKSETHSLQVGTSLGELIKLLAKPVLWPDPITFLQR